MDNNARLGWRKPKAGKKHHYYATEEKPLCGRRMQTNVYLAEEVPDKCHCLQCRKIREKGERI